MELRTFVIGEYDTAVDEELLAFLDRNGCGRYLVVQEHASKRHVHVVFETTRTHAELKADSAALSNAHPTKKRRTTAKVVRHHKDPVTEGFLAYVNKEEYPVILYKKGFTDEELNALHEASEAHVDKLKNGVFEYIKSKFQPEGSPRELHDQVSLLSQQYGYENDKMDPPNIVGLCKYWLRKLAGHRPDVLVYLAGLIVR